MSGAEMFYLRYFKDATIMSDAGVYGRASNLRLTCVVVSYARCRPPSCSSIRTRGSPCRIWSTCTIWRTRHPSVRRLTRLDRTIEGFVNGSVQGDPECKDVLCFGRPFFEPLYDMFSLTSVYGSPCSPPP